MYATTVKICCNSIMKISSNEIEQIKKYHANPQYKPEISRKLFEKIRRFTVSGDVLLYKDRIVLASDRLNELLQKNTEITVVGS